MIVATDLSKSFGKIRAVDSIDLRISRGRVVGFLGRNGAGKTTTIRMIAGSLPPTTGSVAVDGLDVAKYPREVRRRIGYLPESAPLYSEMRVVEYLRFRSRLFGVARGKRKSAIDSAMRRCGLEDARRRTIGHLSKGYRQRVGLAATLLHDPPLLILDEPTVGLDPSQVREVRTLIRELAGSHTILLSTHILSDVERVCDDVIMIADGRIRVQGSLEKLRASLAEGGAYVIETDSGDAEEVIGSLPSIANVEGVSLGGGWYRLVVMPAAGAGDRRELIARTLRKQGAAVRELTREASSLEQLFEEHDAGADRVPPSEPNPERPREPARELAR